MNEKSKQLETLAASKDTSPEMLRKLAGEYPSLRPLVAMNPSTYPDLLQWLANLGDPTINVALQQREAMDRARKETSHGPQRVSVKHRFGETGVSPQPLIEEHPVHSQDHEHTPATFVDTGSFTVKKDKSKHVRIATFVVLFIVVVGSLFWFMSKDSNQAGKPLDAGSPQPHSEASVNYPDAALDQTDSEETNNHKRGISFPAPQGALQVAHVAAPSGNIACVLDEHGVRCSIYDYSFTDSSVASCSNSPATLTAGPKETTVTCSVAPVSTSGATTLAYGDYAENEFGACLSSEFGMTCWNMSSGKSFAVARDGIKTGVSGMIPTSSLPWAN